MQEDVAVSRFLKEIIYSNSYGMEHREWSIRSSTSYHLRTCLHKVKK